jgi:hypothetical protein
LAKEPAAVEPLARAPQLRFDHVLNQARMLLKSWE